MTFEEYQKKSRKTAIYPDLDNNITYPTLGLANEAGEVAGKVKKVFRDSAGVFSQEHKDTIASEIGDVLWYCAQLATELGVTLDEIASENIDKIYSRMDRGVIGGSGDTR
ncbi:MAG: nucleoside triphosphate pyrophosphohydrolase family protein [Candidatus Uhrbacteria bacterium]|nr:nucleoside triphosphate pyrophosphohydrolase family protein [Candidatus Uhrbacteria bacterium]